VRTGYKKLHALFEEWRQMPYYVKVSHAGEGVESKEPTEEQELLERAVKEVACELDLIVRSVEAGH